MREIKDQIWFAIRDNIIKKVWFKVTSILFILLMSIGVYKIYLTPEIKKGVIGNESVWEEFELQTLDFEEKSKSLDGVEEVENSVPSIDGSKIETVINQFFYTANTNNADLFISTIDPEQVDSDFKDLLLNERFEKIDESMNRISRNNQLEKLDVIRSLPVLESKAVRIVLDVYYSDLEKPIRINLIVKRVEQFHSHSEGNEEIDLPYISSSVWDVIEMIENR